MGNSGIFSYCDKTLLVQFADLQVLLGFGSICATFSYRFSSVSLLFRGSPWHVTLLIYTACGLWMHFLNLNKPACVHEYWQEVVQEVDLPRHPVHHNSYKDFQGTTFCIYWQSNTEITIVRISVKSEGFGWIRLRAVINVSQHFPALYDIEGQRWNGFMKNSYAGQKYEDKADQNFPWTNQNHKMHHFLLQDKKPQSTSHLQQNWQIFKWKLILWCNILFLMTLLELVCVYSVCLPSPGGNRW